MKEHKYRTCNLCEAMCGLDITVEDGRITTLLSNAVLLGGPAVELLGGGGERDVAENIRILAR